MVVKVPYSYGSISGESPWILFDCFRHKTLIWFWAGFHYKTWWLLLYKSRLWTTVSAVQILQYSFYSIYSRVQFLHLIFYSTVSIVYILQYSFYSKDSTVQFLQSIFYSTVSTVKILHYSFYSKDSTLQFLQ